MRIAAITGLAAEARILRRIGLVAVASGGDAARTTLLVERLIAEGAEGVLSFGIAGGLDPALAPGTLLLPARVKDESGAVFPVDAAWRARVLGLIRGLAPGEGDLLGAAEAAASAVAKAGLYRRTGCAAVDLESHIAARAAAEAGCPFLVLRAVADPAARDLPPAAAVGLDAAGRPALGPVLRAVAAAPGQIPGLLRVARDTRQALAALTQAAAALGPAA